MADPSQLTTAALQREIAHLSDRVDLKIEGVVAALAARIDAIDKATEVFSENLVRVPTEVQKAVGHLQELTEEKFAGIDERLAGMQRLKDEQFDRIQQQFGERDVRSTNEMESGRQAVAVALQTAKEAVGKSETAQVKAIEQQATLINTQTAATSGQIADIKDRLARIEALAIGVASQKTETSTNSGMVIAIIAVVLTMIGLAFQFIRSLITGR